jgi:hypothetical protein
MELPSSVASGSDAHVAVGASHDARVPRSRAAHSPTTPSLRPCAGMYDTDSATPKSASGSPSAASWLMLKSIASATIFMCGHALMRNIRRGFYLVVESAPAAVSVGVDTEPTRRSHVSRSTAIVDLASLRSER